jgi:putative ABC transport system substrate-binding protein
MGTAEDRPTAAQAGPPATKATNEATTAVKATMNRRTVVRGAIFAFLAAPLAAEAQQVRPVPRIGILWYGPPVTPSANLDAFRQGLRSLGHVEGQTVLLDERYAMGRAERLDQLAAELLSAGATILVTPGPYSSIAAKRSTQSTPIVFVGAHSPIEMGLVASLARPRGNITGVAWNVGPEINAKQLELLKEAAPHLARVAFLYGLPDSPEAPVYLAALDAGARHLGLKLQVLYVTQPEEYDAAFRAVTEGRTEGLGVAGNGRNFVNRKRILEFCARNRLPAAYGWKEAVEEGGLLSYGPELRHLYSRAAVYVDKILKGAKPADLPVEQPTKFELVINIKTAKALGLTIPQSLLVRADQVFE